MLYVVATPIGNLDDITFRAVETLRQVDVILCEDTRVTSKLLSHFQISKPLISYHQHSDAKKINEIKQLLNEGKNLALVTDAGTPSISDPGNQLINHLTIEPFNHSTIHPINHSTIIPIPGPSAVITALSISGFSTDKFTFFGFPPNKNKRQKFFKEIANSEYTAIFYESCHRIKKCLEQLAVELNPNREVVICRELTKKFETIYRGTISELRSLNILEKGEFVIVVNKK